MKNIWGVIGLCLLSVSANAALLNFTLTDNSNNTIFFQLDESPAVSATDFGFNIVDWPVLVNSGVPSSYDLRFFSGGGLIMANIFGSLIIQNSPQLFTGTTVNPNFAPGTFNLTNNSSAATYTSNFDLTISPAPAPPAIWLLGTALAGLGGRGWTRRKITS